MFDRAARSPPGPKAFSPAPRCTSESIQIVGGQQCHALFVVTLVQDVAHGFERPVGGFARSDIVDQQDLGLQHRLEHAHFADRMIGIVAGLNLLQQFAVIVKARSRGRAASVPQCGYGQMRLARAARSHQQDSRFAAGGIVSRERFDDHARLRQPAVPGGGIGLALPKFGVEVFEIAMLVPARNRARGPAHGTSGRLPVQSHGTAQVNLGAAAEAPRIGILALHHALSLLVGIHAFDQPPAGTAAQGAIGLRHDSESIGAAGRARKIRPRIKRTEM